MNHLHGILDRASSFSSLYLANYLSTLLRLRACYNRYLLSDSLVKLGESPRLIVSFRTSVSLSYGRLID